MQEYFENILPLCEIYYVRKTNFEISRHYYLSFILLLITQEHFVRSIHKINIRLEVLSKTEAVNVTHIFTYLEYFSLFCPIGLLAYDRSR